MTKKVMVLETLVHSLIKHLSISQPEKVLLNWVAVKASDYRLPTCIPCFLGQIFLLAHFTFNAIYKVIWYYYY